MDIRIDHINRAGVYFFTHALTTYRRLHEMYSATFKRKPSEGVGHDLTNHTSLSSRFITYLGSIRKEIRPGCRSRPQTMCAGFPSPPFGCHLVHRATVPSLSQAHLYRVPLGRLLTLPTNTRNYLQLPDRGQGRLISREGQLVSVPMRGSSCSWITNT